MSHANSDLPPKTTKQNSARIVAYMNLPRREFQVFPCYSRGLYFPISFLWLSRAALTQAVGLGFAVTPFQGFDANPVATVTDFLTVGS